MSRIVPIALLGIAMMSFALLVRGQRVAFNQTLATPQSAITLLPGETLVQHFESPWGPPTGLTVKLPPSDRERAGEVVMTLRGPDRGTLGSWRVPATAAEAGVFTTPVVTVDAEAGLYTLELTAAQGGLIVGGWSADLGVEEGTGVDRVVLFRDGPAGTGTYIGEAEYGLSRPDVVAVYGAERLERSGWRLLWNTAGVAAGSHKLFIYVHSTITGAWSMTTRPVTLRSNDGPVTPGGTPTGPPPTVAPVVEEGVWIAVDEPAADAIYDPATGVTIAAGTPTRDDTARLVVGGRPEDQVLALTVDYSVPVGDFLSRYPSRLLAGRPDAGLLVVAHMVWLLGIFAVAAAIVAGMITLPSRVGHAAPAGQRRVAREGSSDGRGQDGDVRD